MRRLMLKMSQEKLGDAVGITFQRYKIRKRHEPDRGKTTATHLPNPSGPDGILLRGSAGRTGSAHSKKRRFAGRCHGFHPPERKRAEVGRYLLQVDRQTKGSYDTGQAAEAAGLNYPKVQVSVYDSVDTVNKVINLPQA
jgi:hypothetical protein